MKSDGFFYLKNLKVLREHLEFHPESLKKIEVKSPQIKSETEELLQKFRLKIPIEVRPNIESPILASLEMRILDEHEFFQYIENEHVQKILILDKITDTRNFGAIVRSAAFLGYLGVFVPEHHQTVFSQGAIETAQGGFSCVKIGIAKNLSRAIEKLKEKNFWIIASDMQGQSFESLSSLKKGGVPPIAIIIGNEENGVSKNILNHSDFIISIPSGSLDKTIESLNASVAAGIMMYEVGRVLK